MNKEFIKVRTKADMIKSSALLVFGIIFAVLPTSVEINALAFLALITGALLWIFLKTGWQNTETKECYRKKYVYFPRTDKTKILNALEGQIESIERDGKDQSEGLRMEIYYNEQKAFVTLFEYIPYAYEQTSSTLEFPINRISKLIG